MARAWNAYWGIFPKPLKRLRGGDDNIIVNRCRPIVDKGVDFLFGQDLDIEVLPGAPRLKSAQKYLDAVLDHNRKMTFLMKLGINGGVTGQPMVKIVAEQPYPRLVVLDPMTLDVVTAPDDIDCVTAYAISYSAYDLDSGRTIERRQVIRQGPTPASWQIVEQRQVSDGSWVTDQAVLDWPYSWSPITDGQNLPAPNQYWGLSDIGPDLIQINNDLNFILSNTARIIRFHAHPKTWGKGFQADELKIAIDGTLIIPDKDGTLSNLEMSSDLASSLAFASNLRTAMDELSRVPAIALGDKDAMPKGNVSGIALQVLHQPLIDKTETKRRLYGDLLSELCRRILDMGGYGPDCQVRIHWPAMLPADDESQAKAALLWLQAGASKHTVFSRLLNLDYDTEADLLDSEQEEEASEQPQPMQPMAPATAAAMPMVHDMMNSDQADSNTDTAA